MFLKVVFSQEGRDGAITCRKLVRIRPWSICLCFLESPSSQKKFIAQIAKELKNSLVTYVTQLIPTLDQETKQGVHL